MTFRKNGCNVLYLTLFSLTIHFNFTKNITPKKLADFHISKGANAILNLLVK